MKLVDLIMEFKIESIEKRIIELYPSEKDVVLKGEYANVLNFLSSKDVLDSDMSIVLDNVKDDYGEFYVSVSGLKKEEGKYDNKRWSIEFCDWSKWLGMTIEESSIKEFSKLDILVHCLYEMTFNGFNEDLINESRTSIEDIIKGLKNSSSEMPTFKEFKKMLQ